tara:strand:- start:2369 stop:2686 length:318 start_codon:yes stop_codon:yes gene_type:complete
MPPDQHFAPWYPSSHLMAKIMGSFESRLHHSISRSFVILIRLRDCVDHFLSTEGESRNEAEIKFAIPCVSAGIQLHSVDLILGDEIAYSFADHFVVILDVDHDIK